MSRKKWIVRSKRFLLLVLTILFVNITSAAGSKYAKRSMPTRSSATRTTTFCEVPCRTYRDGSSVSTTDSGSSGGGSTGDTLALADAPFGVTKVLRQCDFKPSYTIDCPGTYVFGEPIRYQGQTANDTTNPLLNECALIIDSDDVTVDLNGYSLTYQICNKPLSARADNVSGICVESDHKNITIRNGAVRYFTGNAIQAIAVADEPISYLIVNEIIANDNKVGMLFRGNASATTGLTGSTTISSLISSSNGITNAITGVRVLQSTANYNDNAGVMFDTVTESEIIGTTTNNNGGANHYGLTTANVAASITDAGSHPTGLDLYNSRRLTLRDNTSTLNKAITANGSSTAIASYGIYLHNNQGSAGYLTTDTALTASSTTNFYVIESTLDHNKTELNDWGFRDELSPSSTVYTRNIAINNGSTKDGRGNYTIFFADTTGAFGLGRLKTFTEVASLSNLQDLDPATAANLHNISIGIAGTSVASSTPGSGNAVITPQT